MTRRGVYTDTVTKKDTANKGKMNILSEDFCLLQELKNVVDEPLLGKLKMFTISCEEL